MPSPSQQRRNEASLWSDLPDRQASHERINRKHNRRERQVSADSADDVSDFGATVEAGGSGAVAEAIEALNSLGYSNSEIMPVLKEIPNSASLTSEELLRQALRMFARRQ